MDSERVRSAGDKGESYPGPKLLNLDEFAWWCWFGGAELEREISRPML